MTNRVDDGKRQPNETWAHYITRNIDFERFVMYKQIMGSKTGMILPSAILCEDHIIEIGEQLDYGESPQTLTESDLYSYVRIRPKNSIFEEQCILSLKLYDDSVDVNVFDPSVIPTSVAETIKNYREGYELQVFVDDLIAGIKKIVDGGENGLRRRD